MASAAELAIKLSLQGQQQTAAGLKDVGTSAGTMGTQVEKAGSAFSGMVKGAAIGAATAALASFAKGSIDAASDLDESMNKVNVVFGQSSAEIKRFASDAATNLGMSEQAALEATGTFGNLFVSMGMGAPAASDMSQGIVKLAADLGSFNNIGTAEALEKIRAGLVGETEPLRALGVNLSAAAIQAKALEMGLADSASALTPAMKAQASYALILEQTTTAQGDFARTSDGLANSSKILDAQLQDLQATVGRGLIPVVGGLTNNAIEATSAVQSLADSFEDFTGAITGSNTQLPSFVELLDSMPMSLGMVTGSLQGVADGVGWLGEKLGVAAEEGRGFGTTMGVIRDAIAEGEAAVASASTSYQTFAETNDRVAESAVTALNATEKYESALGRQAEAAGEANERNSEMALGIELGSGAAAEAAFNLDKLNEAAGRAWEGQQSLTQAWNDATGQMGFWETNVSNAEKALGILTSQGITSGTEFDILTEAVGRYTGGIKDSEGAVVDAAVAQAEFIKKQDELNTKLANGTITQAEYNLEMGEAVGKIDPATGAAYNLATAQDGLATAVSGAVQQVRDLLVDLGLLPAEKKTDVSVPGATEAKQHIQDINYEIDQVPSSFTVTAYADIAPALLNLQILGDSIPHSPAKRGPLAFTPDWSYLTEGVPEAMNTAVASVETGGAAMMAAIASIAGGGGDGLGIIGSMMPDRDSLRMKLMGEWDAILADVEGILNGDVQERLNESIEGLQQQLALAVALGAPQSVVDGINASIAETEAQLALVGEVYAKAIAAGMTSEEAKAEAEAAAAALFQVPIGQLQVAMANMNDGGLALVDELVAGVASGNASFEDAMSTLTQMVEFATDDLVETTGVAADDLIAELQKMEDALLVDLAEALLTGTDPAAIEANLAIIEQLLEQLAATATATAEAFNPLSTLGNLSGPDGTFQSPYVTSSKSSGSMPVVSVSSSVSTSNGGSNGGLTQQQSDDIAAAVQRGVAQAFGGQT